MPRSASDVSATRCTTLPERKLARDKLRKSEPSVGQREIIAEIAVATACNIRAVNVTNSRGVYIGAGPEKRNISCQRGTGITYLSKKAVSLYMQWHTTTRIPIFLILRNGGAHTDASEKIKKIKTPEAAAQLMNTGSRKQEIEISFSLPQLPKACTASNKNATN